MGYKNPEIKTNKFINFSFKLNKVCYLPGENIEGSLFLEGNPGLVETQLMNPKALFIISQQERYHYENNNRKVNQKKEYNEKLDLNIYKNYLVFNNFLGANLLSSINIPFSIQLPYNAHPSCSFKDGSCVKHNLSVEFEHLKIKRTVRIVVKNNPNFTIYNKLLKVPLNYYQTISKSKFLIKKGNFNININLQKNLFYYDEPIPYKIKLDYNNLNLVIKGVIVSLIRQRKKNYLSNLETSYKILNDEINSQYFRLNKNLKEYSIQNTMIFPTYFENDMASPPLVYELIEKKGPYGENIKNFQYLYQIYPSCRGGLLSIQYFIKIKLLFDTSFTNDESFEIPIDFCSRPVHKNINNNFRQISILNNNNSISYSNLNNPSNLLNNEYINSFENNAGKNNIEKNNITEGKDNDYNNNNEDINIDKNDDAAPHPAYDSDLKNMNTYEK